MSNFLVWLVGGFIIKMLGGLGKLHDETYITIFVGVGLTAAIVDLVRLTHWVSRRMK